MPLPDRANERSRLLDRWRQEGKPAIPLWHGMYVGDLPKFLDYCTRTGRFGGIETVAEYLRNYEERSPEGQHDDSKL